MPVLNDPDKDGGFEDAEAGGNVPWLWVWVTDVASLGLALFPGSYMQGCNLDFQLKRLTIQEGIINEM